MSKVISADSHVQEPPELYERIPKSLRHRVPRIVERDGGRACREARVSIDQGADHQSRATRWLRRLT